MLLEIKTERGFKVYVNFYQVVVKVMTSNSDLLPSLSFDENSHISENKIITTATDKPNLHKNAQLMPIINIKKINDLPFLPYLLPSNLFYLLVVNLYRVRNFRGRVSHFNQSEARKQCFLASDWLKYETLPRKFRTL